MRQILCEVTHIADRVPKQRGPDHGPLVVLGIVERGLVHARPGLAAAEHAAKGAALHAQTVSAP